MSDISFEWDQRKHSANRRRHDTSFVEAQTVFTDDNGLLLDDPDHSEGEERCILLRLSSKLRLLVVCHTYRKDEATKGLSQPVRRRGRNKNNTGTGGEHEKRV